MADGVESKIDELVEEVERCNKEYKTKIKSVPVTTGDFHDGYIGTDIGYYYQADYPVHPCDWHTHLYYVCQGREIPTRRLLKCM